MVKWWYPSSLSGGRHRSYEVRWWRRVHRGSWWCVMRRRWWRVRRAVCGVCPCRWAQCMSFLGCNGVDASLPSPGRWVCWCKRGWRGISQQRHRQGGTSGCWSSPPSRQPVWHAPKACSCWFQSFLVLRSGHYVLLDNKQWIKDWVNLRATAVEDLLSASSVAWPLMGCHHHQHVSSGWRLLFGTCDYIQRLRRPHLRTYPEHYSVVCTQSYRLQSYGCLRKYPNFSTLYLFDSVNPWSRVSATGCFFPFTRSWQIFLPHLQSPIEWRGEKRISWASDVHSLYRQGRIRVWWRSGRSPIVWWGKGRFYEETSIKIIFVLCGSITTTWYDHTARIFLFQPAIIVPAVFNWLEDKT